MADREGLGLLDQITEGIRDAEEAQGLDNNVSRRTGEAGEGSGEDDHRQDTNGDQTLLFPPLHEILSPWPASQ